MARYALNGKTVLRDAAALTPQGERQPFVQVLLACGHWSQQLHEGSSVFDFPTDPTFCEACVDDRYLDLDLINRLLTGQSRRQEGN